MSVEDPRRARSRAALIAAITAALDEGRDPSITDLVTAAGVSRPTFYQHFGDLPTAYREAGLARLQAEFDRIDVPDQHAAIDFDRQRAIHTRLIEHLQEHRTFYVAVLGAGGDRAVTDAVVDFVADRILRISPYGPLLRRGSDQAAADKVAVLSAGLVHLIVGWLLAPDAGPPDALADRLVDVLASLTERT